MIHSCATYRNINRVAIHSQVCFHRRLYANCVKPHWCIAGPVGPLGRTNQSWCGVKLLTMSLSTHPVGCVYICHLLRGQHHSMHLNGSFCLPSACHPPYPLPPAHRIYTRSVILQGL